MKARTRRRHETQETAGASATSRNGGVLLDTGVLVALYARDDPKHDGAAAWLAAFRGSLHTVEPVLTEAAHFLPARTRPAIADIVASGRLCLHHADKASYERLAILLRKYVDMDPGWADLELVWLAETTGIVRIATLDITDFGVYRIHGRKRFEIELLR